MKNLLTQAYDCLLSLGRALKPRSLQKEADQAKQLAKESKERLEYNKAKLKEMRRNAYERSIGYVHGEYDSNLN
jgi:isopropylmalate/homocitrate/citramalate synthase